MEQEHLEPEHLTKTQEREMRRLEKNQHARLASHQERSRRWKLTGIVIVILGLFVALVVWQKNQPPVSVAETFSDPTKGNVESAVVLREFSDLQCPACRSVQPMVKQIIEEFKEDIKFVYEDFPLPSHKNGAKAAEAGQCAYEDGKFFEFQEKMFAEQDAWAGLANPSPSFLDYGESVGMDRAEFEACLNSGGAKEAVDEDVRQGRALNVAATPSFFVNDRLISNLRTIEDFRQAIREALDATGAEAESEIEAEVETEEGEAEAEIINTNP